MLALQMGSSVELTCTPCPQTTPAGRSGVAPPLPGLPDPRPWLGGAKCSGVSRGVLRVLEHPPDLKLLRILMGLTKHSCAGRLARCLDVPVIL